MKLHGSHCDLGLKPPKISANSKKIYKGIFIRKLGRFSHLYHLDGLYLVSIHQSVDVFSWIDKNTLEIHTRRWNEEDKHSYTKSLFD